MLHGVLATLLVRGIGAGAALGTIAIMARSLSTPELGLVLTIASIWMVVLMVTELGIGPVLANEIAVAHGRDDDDGIRTHVEVASVTLCALALVVITLGTLATFLLPWTSWIGKGVLTEATVVPAVLVAFISAGLNLPVVVGSSILTGMQRQARAQTRQAVGSVLSVAGCAAAAWAAMPPWVFVAALLGTPVITGLIYTAHVLGIEYPHLRPRRVPRTASEFTTLVGAAGYMSVVRITDALVTSTGVIVVAVLHGPAMAATFGVASRICLLPASVLQTAGSQLWPPIAEALSRGDRTWAMTRYRRGVALVGVVSLTSGLALCVLGPWLARLLTDDKVPTPITLFLALAAMTTVATVNIQMAIIAGARQMYRQLAVAFSVAAPVALTLSVVLTWTVGVEGPAIAAAVAYGLTVTPQIVVLARRTSRSLASADDVEPG